MDRCGCGDVGHDTCGGLYANACASDAQGAEGDERTGEGGVCVQVNLGLMARFTVLWSVDWLSAGIGYCCWFLFRVELMFGCSLVHTLDSM